MAKSNHPTADQSFADINKLRAHLGLRPIKSGDMKCLRCNFKFESSDIRIERMCEPCRIASRKL